jgi:beta-galactosidase GanA
VDLRRRVGAGGSYLFVMNRTDDTVDVAMDDTEALDLLTGAPVRGVVRLGPQGVAVVRSSDAGPG